MWNIREFNHKSIEASHLKFGVQLIKLWYLEVQFWGSTQHEQEYQDQLPKSICCVISVCSTSIPGCPADEWTTSRTSKQVASWQINMGQTTLHSRLDCWCTTLNCYFLIWSKVKSPRVENINWNNVT